jgi:hypothetical protein
VLGAIVAVSLGHNPSPHRAQAGYNAAFAAATGAVLLGLAFAWSVPKLSRNHDLPARPIALLPFE